jgi:hypothetical protein
VGGIDATTWQALGLVLTLLGLGLSALVWRRRGTAPGLRAAAWSLLPAAAGFTGTLRLVWQIGNDVGDWAVRLIFSPVVWLGISLAVVAVVLFVVSGAMRSRGVGVRSSAPGRRSGAAVGDRASAPPARGPAGDDGMDDIEAILRKHGIQ